MPQFLVGIKLIVAHAFIRENFKHLILEHYCCRANEYDYYFYKLIDLFYSDSDI